MGAADSGDRSCCHGARPSYPSADRVPNSGSNSPTKHRARLAVAERVGAAGQSDCEADKSEAGHIVVGAMKNGVHIRRTRMAK